jgi:multidrug efflux system membrane fusion protein
MSPVRRSFLLYGLPLLVLLGAFIWWFSRPTTAAPRASAPVAAPVLVHTALVTARDMPIRLEGLGAVQAWASVTVRSRIDGQLESVGFQEGDVVRQGQLLARLDDRVQKAQLDQALAQRARDQAQLDNARADLKRYVELARQSAIDRQTLDTQRAQVAVLQATLQSDEAQIESARTLLDYTRIVAPLTGRTGVLQVDPGNLVRASDAGGLVVINQVDPVAVLFTVPDTAFAEVQAAVKAGLPLVAEVRNRGQAGVLARGELVLVDNQIDAASGTLRLKARLDNAAQALWPGQSVDVRLILGHRPGALVVPDTAVLRGAQGLYAYVVQADDRVRMQPVEVLVSQDGLSLVAQGLQAGERVVVDGQYKLRPGLKIAEAPDAKAAEAGTPGTKAAAGPGAGAGTAPGKARSPGAPDHGTPHGAAS